MKKIKKSTLLLSLLACACHASAAGLIANPDSFLDSEFYASGALELINAQEAYARGYTGKNVLVAYLDSGLYVQHPEFKGRVVGAYSYDPTRADWDVSDTEIDEKTGKIIGHGTHVAGLIAAARDGVGMHGVAYDSFLMPIHGDLDDDRYAIDKAIEAGAQVFNGSYGPDALEDINYQLLWTDEIINHHADQLRRASAADIVMVFAAGNDYLHNPVVGSNASGYGMYHLINPEYWQAHGEDPFYRFLRDPSEIIEGDESTYYRDFHDPLVRDLDLSDLAGSILVVASVDPVGEIASYSNRCGASWHYCIAAPGGDLFKYPNSRHIWSTHPEPSYGYYYADHGTSMAAPVVAGAAVVVRQAFPFLTARQVIETLLTTANSDGLYSAREIYGRGLLDLGKAVLGPSEFGAEGFPDVFMVNTKGYDAVFGNNISGAGGLLKTGLGSLRLTGANTYQGATHIHKGKLIVDGSISQSRLIVGPKGVLSGHGIVGPTTVLGRIAPGNSIGTLTFSPKGSDPTALRTQAGAVLEIEIDEDGRSDQLNVLGDAELAGGKVLVLGLKGGVVGQQFSFMNVAGTVSGQGLEGFVNDDYTFINLNLIAQASGYNLAVLRNNTRFSDLGKTKNQRHSGTAIEALAAGALPYETLITLQHASQAPKLYEQFSGELHASLNTTMFTDTQMVQRAIIDQMSLPYQNAASLANKGDIWGQALASWGRHDGAGIAHATKRNSTGLMFGRNFGSNDNELGIAFAYTRSRTQAENHNRGNLDGFHLIGHGGTKAGPLHLRAGLNYSRYTLNTKRNFQNPNLAKHKARYHGASTSLFAETSLQLPLENTVLEPFVGISQTWQRTKKFNEDGVAALKGQAAHNNFSQAEIGLRSHWKLQTNSNPVHLSAGASWLHTFGRLAPKIKVAHKNAQPYTLHGAPLARNALQLDLKASTSPNTNTRLDLSYHGQIGGGVRDHALRLQVDYQF